MATVNSGGDEQSFCDSYPRGETESQVSQENAWTLTTPVTSQRAPHAWGNVGPGLMLPGGVVVERSADGSAAHSSVRRGPAEDRARAVKHFFPKMGGKRSRGGSPGLAGAEGSLGIPKWYAGSVYAAGGGGRPWGRATGRPRGDMDSPGGGGSGLVTRTQFPIEARWTRTGRGE